MWRIVLRRKIVSLQPTCLAFFAFHSNGPELHLDMSYKVLKRLQNVLTRLQHVRTRLQHVRSGSNMSGCNLLEQAATCPGATRSNSWQHVLLEHARTGIFMLHFVTANRFMVSISFLLHCQQSLKCLKQRLKPF